MVAEIPADLTTSIVTSTLVFLALTLVIINRAVYSLKIPKNKRLGISLAITLVLVGWFSFVYVLGQNGYFAEPLFSISSSRFLQISITAPNIIFAFLVLFIGVVLTFSSKTLQMIFDAIPQPWIIGIQTYRLVGYGFIILYNLGLLPGEFAFPAGLGDMIVGFGAPFVAYLYFLKKPYSKKLAIAWNIIGIADLVIAIGVGILGYPIPFQILPTDPSTKLLSLFPLVIIPAFSVPLALILHLFSLSFLLKK